MRNTNRKGVPCFRILVRRSAADGVHLDGAVARVRAAARDLDRLLAARDVDDPESADDFLGLGEGSVAHERLPAAHADRARRPKRGRAAPRAGASAGSASSRASLPISAKQSVASASAGGAPSRSVNQSRNSIAVLLLGVVHTSVEREPVGSTIFPGDMSISRPARSTSWQAGGRVMITVYVFGNAPRPVWDVTRDLRVLWALEETGLPYRLHPLDFARGELKASGLHADPALRPDPGDRRRRLRALRVGGDRALPRREVGQAAGAGRASRAARSPRSGPSPP